MDELVKQLLGQMPMVAILVVVLWQQTQAHQKSIDYYRARDDKFTDWLLSHFPRTDILDEVEKS